jgi:hypothetical protein
MSANNWRKCPNCMAAVQNARLKKIANAKAQYGVVSAEKFVELVRRAELPVVLGDALREDYEIGIDDAGLFSVSYRCSCNICPFVFSHKSRKQVVHDAAD